MTNIDIYAPQDFYDSIATLYAAASDDYFPFAADRLVELAAPRPGDLVLDVACGPGLIAQRAAERVGPDGSVLGVDVSRRMLDQAAERAAAKGTLNAAFFPGNFHALPFLPGTFDRVLCGMAIFFAKDVPDVVRRLWSLVRPDGVLAISTFSADFFSPWFDMFLKALPSSFDVEPFLVSRKIEAHDVLERIVLEAGVPNATITTETTEISFPNGSDDFWRIADSTGIHRMETELEVDTAAKVRAAVTAEAAARSLTSVKLGLTYIVAHREA